MLETLQSWAGFGRIHPGTGTKLAKKPYWVLHFNTLSNLQILLELVSPYLIIKAEQANLLQELIRLKGLHPRIHGSAGFSPATPRENEIFARIRQLNGHPVTTAA